MHSAWSQMWTYLLLVCKILSSEASLWLCLFFFFLLFSEAVNLSQDIMGQIQVIHVCINPIWGNQLSSVLVFSVGAAANYCPGLTEVSYVLFAFWAEDLFLCKVTCLIKRGKGGSSLWRKAFCVTGLRSGELSYIVKFLGKIMPACRLALEMSTEANIWIKW